MRYLEIAGGRPLYGEITVQGSKNAALPVLAACLLGDGPCIIENCPRIQDVEDTLEILRKLGCRVYREGNVVSVDASGMDSFSVSVREASRIRSSILFLGALLGKMGKAMLPYPGGCAIGSRPIDLHLLALKKLGVRFSQEPETEDTDSAEKEIPAKAGHSPEENCRILAEAEHLHGGYIRLAAPSVGATENTILAAVLADGETVIENAAQEPEVLALCSFLKLRGAEITYPESGRIRIIGQKKLFPVHYRLGADRIVAGSYLLAAAACGGHVRLYDFPARELDALLFILKRMGTDIREEYSAGVEKNVYGLEGKRPDGEGCLLHCMGTGKTLQSPGCVRTAPYPGFPTDLQSPLLAVLCQARGESILCETIFENRFQTVGQLRKMGAQICIDRNCARISGPAQMHGAGVCAPDLRGGAALTGAALAASGRTKISGYEYIARGYEDICRDYKNLGADICLTE